MINRKCLDNIDIRIIEAFADCDLNICKTARNLNLHRDFVRSRIFRIKRITKLDPRRFYDLIQLLYLFDGNGEEEKLDD